MIQQTDVFLRDFIGYHQHQIADLDIKWETHTEGLNAGYAAATPAGPQSWCTRLLTET